MGCDKPELIIEIASDKIFSIFKAIDSIILYYFTKIPLVHQTLSSSIAEKSRFKQGSLSKTS